MKKISMILMAFALAVTMSQCKKNEGQPTSNDEVVTITLDVTQNNGSRVVVNPSTGTVDFETGDKIYVGSGGKYVGFLTHNGTNFIGNITNPIENQPLQFYFLGNVTPAETLAAGTTEECSVIISDQTEHLPVISCAASYENYVSGVTAYSAHLLNKCALVKFSVTTISTAPICITGMKNKVTVDFTQNTVTPNIDGNGVIMLSAGSGENVEKWAILLPQEAMDEGEEGSAYSGDGIYTGTRAAIPVIAENDYLSANIAITVNTQTISEIPAGAINGLFIINEQGDHVYFSQGNLQYIGSASTPYWKFADNQWDCLGNNQSGSSQTIDRDLFGWGTSGYDHGAICYQPWSLSINASDYYIYNDYHLNLYDHTGKADWGYNAISNGGNTENSGWRTLTRDEWNYLFNTRPTLSGIRYAKGIVNNVNGIILLPTDWSISTYELNYVNNGGVLYSDNIISAEDWTNIFETNGAVFLPSAGNRWGVSCYSVGDVGFYWSASCFFNGGQNAGMMEFYDSSINFTTWNRGGGCSVRLVKDY